MTEKIKDYALKQVLAEILEEIHTLSGCQSVGIRLQDNGDYPYYVHEGFPDFFILQENTLCARDDEGNSIRDEKGNPLLECVCGNVLKGYVDQKLPYFTENGSFWTNSTTQLLSSGKLNDWKALERIRGMCPRSGYESVALIPMRADGKTLGLIQLNDPREDMFTTETIERYELMADKAGAVVYNAFEIQEGMANIFEFAKKLEELKKK